MIVSKSTPRVVQEFAQRVRDDFQRWPHDSHGGRREFQEPLSDSRAGTARGEDPRSALFGTHFRVFPVFPLLGFKRIVILRLIKKTCLFQRVSEQGHLRTLFERSVETDHIDVFIGHSWSAGRWQKYLALCLYFNLERALWCSIAAWSLVAGLFLGVGGLTSLGGSYLALPCLVYLPMAVFFVTLLFGQQLVGAVCGLGSPSLWLDRLCVHQTDEEQKAEQIAALPIFVANSRRMLILWDDTYFATLNQVPRCRPPRILLCVTTVPKRRTMPLVVRCAVSCTLPLMILAPWNACAFPSRLACAVTRSPRARMSPSTARLCLPLWLIAPLQSTVSWFPCFPG